ncbi:hypothetical protein [Deinococcus sp. KNUC1210]|uniref:hypothetical protein n=1 Tax=Deinococcus sp. KNUC1210 TaxID=2917691 RepID=UPI00351D827C
MGAALGRRLEQVVVQRADDAREIIETLKRLGGRATFLPLDLLRPRPRRDAALLHERGVLGNLADLCPSDPPIIGQNLLSDTLLVQDLAAATALARRHASRPRLVTLEGELLEPGGALTGGRLRDSGAGVLADQRRLLELDDELSTLDASVTRVSGEQATLSAELQQLNEQQGQLNTAVSAARVSERAAQLARAEAEARHTALLRQHAVLLARLERARPAEAAAPDQSADLPALEAALESLRAQAEAASQSERTAALQLAGGRELAAAWKAHHAALLRSEALQVRLTTTLHSGGEQRAQLATLQTEVRRRLSDLGEFDPAEQPRAEALREQVSAAYSAQIARQNQLQAQLDEARLTLARREGSLPTVPDGALPPASRVSGRLP